MMRSHLSKQEAYDAMFCFLRNIYERNESDDLGALLGSMIVLEEGETADPAVWQDWEEAIDKILNN